MCTRVSFTDKDWATKDYFEKKYLPEILSPFVKKAAIDDFLLYMDNLGAQKKLTYIRPLQKIGGEGCFGPENVTEGWQPIDAGHIGAVIKTLAKGCFESWTEQFNVTHPDKRNDELWEQNKITASEKRILMTYVFGEAWMRLQEPKYKRMMINLAHLFLSFCSKRLKIKNSKPPAPQNS